MIKEDDDGMKYLEDSMVVNNAEAITDFAQASRWDDNKGSLGSTS